MRIPSGSLGAMSDINWHEYKSVLRRVYFGEDDECIAPRDSAVATDFWRFFDKSLPCCPFGWLVSGHLSRYVAMAVKKRARADRDEAWREPELSELGLPHSFAKFHRSNLKSFHPPLPRGRQREMGQADDGPGQPLRPQGRPGLGRGGV